MKKIKKLEIEELRNCIRRGRLYRKEGKYDLSISEFEKIFSNISHDDDPFINNLALNEIEISQKKTILKSRPRQLGVNLTHRCNINCLMCFYPSSPWDIPEPIVKEIIDYIPYLQRVFWQGGEPFIYKHFEELFEKAANNINLCQTIVTNGLLIDEKWAKRLVSSNATLVISIDGAKKETYEYIRTGARYENLVNNLEILSTYREKYGNNNRIFPPIFELIMQTTILKFNYNEIGQLVEFARKYKFDGLNIIPIQNVYGPENIFFHKDRQALEHIEKVMPKLEDEARRYGIRLQNSLPSVSIRDDPDKPKKPKDENNEHPPACNFKNKNLSCLWPWLSLFILFEGKVKPYGFCRKDVEPDLNSRSLAEIWNNDFMQQYRKKLIDNVNLDFCDPRCYSGIFERDLMNLDTLKLV